MRLTENQLRKFIRNIILAEGMKMPEDLGDNLRVVVVNSGYDSSIKKYLPPAAYEVNLIKKDQGGEFEVGSVAVSYSLRCNSFEVVVAYSDIDKYGPLLYDVALEVAGDQGLIPDRNQVSIDAEKVWRYYLRRRYDISAKPIQNLACDSPRGFFAGGKEKFGEYDWANWTYYQTQGTPMTDRLLKLNKITFMG
jgi:hypothetical protein